MSGFLQIIFPLTSSFSLPIFTANETITNLTQYQLSQEKSDLLISGLYFSMQSDKIWKSKIFNNFEKIHRLFISNLKSDHGVIILNRSSKASLWSHPRLRNLNETKTFRHQASSSKFWILFLKVLMWAWTISCFYNYLWLVSVYFDVELEKDKYRDFL